jgi:hypothetical protein
MTMTTTLSPFWEDAATRADMSEMERAALAQYVAEHEAEFTANTTTNSVIAAALGVVTNALLDRSLALDAQLSTRIGEQIGHGILADGSATVTLYASTTDHMLTAVSTGERVGYRINRDAYRTPDDIPTARRKFKTIATAFQREHDAGALRDAVAAYVETENARKRWITYDRASA